MQFNLYKPKNNESAAKVADSRKECQMTTNINKSIKRCITKYRNTKQPSYLIAISNLWHKRRLLQAGAGCIDVTKAAIRAYGACIPLTYSLEMKHKDKYMLKKLNDIRILEPALNSPLQSILWKGDCNAN